MITTSQAVAAALRAHSPQGSNSSWVLGACLALAAVAAPGAFAAEAADEALTEVQITGSRIQQRQDFVSPNPITTLGAGDLEKLGIVNIADAMIQIPQNVSQFTPANTGGSAFFIGSTLANLRGLNPFFGTRTLTLVDSRRFIPTTQGDSVDLNFIPSNLIARTEVVTGGASAAYGSGAISGVVNVLLDTRMTGIKLEADYGATTHGDGKNHHVGIAGGTAFAGGRGHIIAGGEFQTQDAIQSCADAREWCGRGTGLFNNNTGFAFTAGVPISPKIPGQPHYIVTSGLRENQTSSAGVIFLPNLGGAFGPGGLFAPPGGTPLPPLTSSTWQFNAAGTDIVPFTIGQQGWRGPGGTVVGGDGDVANTNLSLYPEVERKTFFTHAEFDFTDNLSTYLELSYGQVEGTNHQWGTGQNTAQNCIRPDNAYLGTLSAAARTALAAQSFNNPFATFPNEVCTGTVLSKNWYPQNDQTVTTDTKVTRGVLGFKGRYFETWTWDAYYQYGKTKRDQIGSGYRTNWRYTMALDAILDPRAGSPTFGQPICRVTVTGMLPDPTVSPSLAAGCQPLNPFGTAAASAAGLAYAFGSLTEHDDIRQDVIAASTTGELWEGWGAGPLSAAVGVEYRKDELNNDAGDLPTALRTDFSLQYGDSFAGSTEVTEEFVELEMPLLRDRPGVRLLTLNAAGRHAKYETEGGLGTVGGTNSSNITTYKFASVWEPIDWLRLRGSYSKDIRAAGFRELFYSQTIPPGGIFGTVENPFINPSIPGLGQAGVSDASSLILSGNPAIDPEEATTRTVGFVLSPSGWADRMHFSADYYRIKLDGGMALEGAQNNVNLCFDGDQAACSLIVFGPPLPGNSARSNILSVRALYRNQSAYETSGVDFAFDYSLPLDSLMSGSAGNLLFRLTASHTLETIIPSGVDVAGQVGGDQGFLSDFASSPDWSGNLTVSYLNGPFSATVQTRYVSPGPLDLQNPKTDPTEPGYNPLLSYSVTDNSVGGYFVFGLNAAYDFKWFGTERFELWGSVNNVLDRDPPFSAGAVGGANATFYDALGRTYRVGVRLKL
jgi:outer membrane receptor protein involved in Fe transport